MIHISIFTNIEINRSIKLDCARKHSFFISIVFFSPFISLLMITRLDCLIHSFSFNFLTQCFLFFLITFIFTITLSFIYLTIIFYSIMSMLHVALLYLTLHNQIPYQTLYMLSIEINKKCGIETNKSVKLKYKLGFLQNSLITDTF